MIWKLFFAALLAMAVVAPGCENLDTPLSPTGTNPESSHQAAADGEKSAVSAEAAAANLGLTAGDSGQNCGDPSDWLSDDTALQNCLDRGGNIFLSYNQGDPGYIVNRGLWLTRPGTVLTSSGAAPAKIIAGRDLFSHILRTPPHTKVNNFVIQNISFDGMVDAAGPDGRPYRLRRDDCSDNGSAENNTNPGNLVLEGSGFQFRNNESVGAMCGSGLGLFGDKFYVDGNYIAQNGRDKLSGGRGVPWADGMTVLYCAGGYIAHNTFVDNTDIDLVVGGGRGCVVELNEIAHFGKFGFAGLNIGNFVDGGNGDHSGSEYRGNKIYSRIPNRLAMGILVGTHPWSDKLYVSNAGRVVGNTSYGNVMNLVVDGARGGEITGNILNNPQGNEGLGNCRISGVNYAVFPAHVVNTILQGGWTILRYDNGSCASG